MLPSPPFLVLGFSLFFIFRLHHATALPLTSPTSLNLVVVGIILAVFWLVISAWILQHRRSGLREEKRQSGSRFSGETTFADTDVFATRFSRSEPTRDDLTERGGAGIAKWTRRRYRDEVPCSAIPTKPLSGRGEAQRSWDEAWSTRWGWRGEGWQGEGWSTMMTWRGEGRPMRWFLNDDDEVTRWRLTDEVIVDRQRWRDEVKVDRLGDCWPTTTMWQGEGRLTRWLLTDEVNVDEVIVKGDATVKWSWWRWCHGEVIRFLWFWQWYRYYDDDDVKQTNSSWLDRYTLIHLSPGCVISAMRMIWTLAQMILERWLI